MIRNLIVLALLATAWLMAQTSASGKAENGKRQFVKLGCYTCHGYEGQGGGAGAKLAPNPIATAALIAYVRHPAGTMPPFTKKVVSDEDLIDIHAYLASIAAPPPAKDIPLLSQ